MILRWRWQSVILGLVLFWTARYAVKFFLLQTSSFLVFNSDSSLLPDLFPGHEEMLIFDQLSLSFGDIKDGSNFSFSTFNKPFLPLPPSSGSLFKFRSAVKFASLKFTMRREAIRKEAGERGTSRRTIFPSKLSFRQNFLSVKTFSPSKLSFRQNFLFIKTLSFRQNFLAKLGFVEQQGVTGCFFGKGFWSCLWVKKGVAFCLFIRRYY